MALSGALSDLGVVELIQFPNAGRKTGELVIYPGAPHGFFADYRPTYRAEAAGEAWKRALGWFGHYLKG